MNATDVYSQMYNAIHWADFRRQVRDPESPNREPMSEAVVGWTYRLDEPKENIVRCRRVDLRWACANLLHFFARTEGAAPLKDYNRFSGKYLTGDRFVGAYGPICLPQVDRCIALLTEFPDSRRAVVSMIDPDGCIRTQNSPCCWCTLHLLNQGRKLNLLVYQRSLSLAVMPYDCVLLTNVLLHAAERLNVPVGSLIWTVGSLHASQDDTLRPVSGPSSMVFDSGVLGYPGFCYDALCHPDLLVDPFYSWLRGEL